MAETLICPHCREIVNMEIDLLREDDRVYCRYCGNEIVEAQEVIHIRKVVIYSNGCPKCNILKQRLNDKNIPYELVNDIEIMKSKGFMSVPMLEVDAVILDFNNAVKWLKEI